MTALGWLNDFARWLAAFVPRLTMVPPTHRGVLFGPRGRAREVGPGLVFWWPVAYQLVRIAITIQSLELNARSMPMEDGGRALFPRVALCGLAVQYRVADPVKAAVSSLNLHALIDNRCQAALGAHWKDLVSVKATLVESLVSLRPWLREEFGVDLERLDVTHLGVGVALLNISSWGYTDSTEAKPRGEE